MIVPTQFAPPALLATIVFFSVTVPPLLRRPLPAIAELPENVLFVTLTAPLTILMPPPEPTPVLAVLPENVLLPTVSGPAERIAPPVSDEFPMKALLFTVSGPPPTL